MTSIPEISARGWLILWAAFSGTNRPPIGQREREMSRLRPYETYPFHPPSSVHVPTVVSISIYIQKFSTCFFHMVYTMCLGTVYISRFRMRSCRNTLEVILLLIWYVLVCAVYPLSSVCNLHFYLSLYVTPRRLPAFYTDRSFFLLMRQNCFANRTIAWQRSRASLPRFLQALPSK